MIAMRFENRKVKKKQSFCLVCLTVKFLTYERFDKKFIIMSLKSRMSHVGF